MINLIPNKEKKEMTLDFYYRLAIVFFIMLDFCILVFVIAIAPSYFLSSEKSVLINAKLEAQKKETLPLFDQQTLASIKSVNDKLDLVENAEKNKFSLSLKVINALLSKKRADIKIIQIIYENDKILGKKVSVAGTAPSRAILLLFRRALEGNPVFKSVDLPISNFVKGSDIQFYLTLVPA